MKKKTISPSRRDFLRRLSFTTAALASGLNLPIVRSVRGRGQERKLGIALLGLGRYATNQLAPALLQTKRCHLAGVVTGHPEKGEKWAATYELNRKNIYNYENFDRIADNREIDIVYVVTPPALHPDFVIRAARAGKHVISEKPMATSIADCDRMIAACRTAKVKLGVGYRLHYDPYHKEMMRLANEQQMGPFMKMNGVFSFVLGQRAFRVGKKLGGGGPLMDLGIYLIHGACMANGGNPSSVIAQEEPKKKPELFNEVEETIRWTMNFPNGASCEARSSFNQSGNQFRVEGEKGWVDFKRSAFSYSGIECETSRGPLNYPPTNQQAVQMDDFADCILSKHDTPVPGELGRRDLQIITAIYESARTNKPVKVRTT